jgi:orotate phosphoribosyltransferase
MPCKLRLKLRLCRRVIKGMILMSIKQEKNHLIDLLKANHVIKFGKFTLSSGKESDYYVDMKKAITDPQILSQIAKIISVMINKDEIERVAGPALGAVPIATAVALNSGIPMLMIRKAQKDYGTSKLIEGELKEGDRVIVVEDVTTTGNSLLKAIKAVVDNGGIMERAFVVVDREEGAVEELKKEGLLLEPLVSISDVK